MYVEEIKRKVKGKSYKTVLVRESYRQGTKVLHRTIANISKLPSHCIQHIKNTLKGEKLNKIDDLAISNSREYGASKTVIHIAKEIGLDKMIYSRKTQWSQNALAMIAGRIIYPGSKLSLTNKYLDTVLWELCGYSKNTKPNVRKECYQSMDKLLNRQKSIQKQFADKHLHDGCIVLYDITSTYFEGEYEDSALIQYGYSRDCKKGHEQVNIGLLTNSEGCPIAVETFSGNTQDQVTVKGQAKDLANDFNVKEVIFVGDRGMLTPKRICEVNENGFKTITAMTRPQIQDLISRGVIKLTSFKEDEYPEIQEPNGSGVRYILCLNPKRKKADGAVRMKLINITALKLDQIRNSKTKRSKEKIGSQVGKVLAKYKTGKYFQWSITDGNLEYHFVQEAIDRDKMIDGCYIIRTDVAPEILPSKDVYEAYKKLIHVEQAFRTIKTTALEIRPVFHHLDDRIRAHIFLCMLSYYLQWHMNQKLSKVYKNDGKGENRRWTFQQVIERLRAIRSQEATIGGVKISDIISVPDKEQKMLLEALGLEL